MARFVVLEGVDDAAASRTAARLGLATREVRDPTSAAQVVLAAVAGHDLMVHATAPRELIDQLCDDLSRLGELDHRVGEAESGPHLTVDEHDLIAHLLAGNTLGEAARALHLSRRTADRRLASARRTLGASSTSEALVIARRNGVSPAE